MKPSLSCFRLVTTSFFDLEKKYKIGRSWPFPICYFPPLHHYRHKGEALPPAGLPCSPHLPLVGEGSGLARCGGRPRHWTSINHKLLT